ncbi:MAG: hypothetical protein D6720_11900 [Gammaproteobacteria bacterium]|nr:MAG: hypothetical protein D6720_11900 [Gammaproteobacteria bacterium]
MPVLTQLHIDVARNATDDFNPFHDPRRWKNIANNPFGGPIALGFQLVAFAMDQVAQHRETAGQPHGLVDDGPDYGVLRFSFAGAVRPDTALEVQVRRANDRLAEHGEISNRVLIRDGQGAPVLLGSHKDCAKPGPSKLAEPPPDLPLDRIADRSFTPNGFFLKRKFLMTANAKNFCTASLVPQHRYIDELADKVRFPASFPLALVSCALLERARSQGHDFERQPFIYTEHRFVVNNRLQRQLHSNQVIHLLVGPARSTEGAGGLGGSRINSIVHDCQGVLDDGQALFEGVVTLAPLEAVLHASAADQASSIKPR